MLLEHSNLIAFCHHFVRYYANTIAMENMDRWAHCYYRSRPRWHHFPHMAGPVWHYCTAADHASHGKSPAAAALYESKSFANRKASDTKKTVRINGIKWLYQKVLWMAWERAIISIIVIRFHIVYACISVRLPCRRCRRCCRSLCVATSVDGCAKWHTMQTQALQDCYFL